MTSLTRWATDAAASLPSIVVVRAMMVASRCWLSEPDPLDGDESQRRLAARSVPLCKKGTTATTFGSPAFCRLSRNTVMDSPQLRQLSAAVAPRKVVYGRYSASPFTDGGGPVDRIGRCEADRSRRLGSSRSG
jgi:hypothetical protein